MSGSGSDRDAAVATGGGGVARESGDDTGSGGDVCCSDDDAHSFYETQNISLRILIILIHGKVHPGSQNKDEYQCGI